jgi:L-seryl-tRNA(Ser) seleniumtransferase
VHEAIPVLAMLTAPVASIRARAAAGAVALRGRGMPCEVIETEATVGGGAFPTSRIPSCALAVTGDVERLEAALRAAPLPLVARLAEGRLVVDFRSLAPGEDALAIDALVAGYR